MATAPTLRADFDDRWAMISPGHTEDPVNDAVLADRWNGAMWPGGNASDLALRLYGLLDELIGEVLRVDMKEDRDDIAQVMDVDGLEHVIGAWILDRAFLVVRTVEKGAAA